MSRRKLKGELVKIHSAEFVNTCATFMEENAQLVNGSEEMRIAVVDMVTLAKNGLLRIFRFQVSENQVYRLQMKTNNRWKDI